MQCYLMNIRYIFYDYHIKYSQGSEYYDYKKGYQGPAMYIFDQSLKPKFYKVYDFIKGAGKQKKEQEQVDLMTDKLDCKYS